MKTKTTFTRKQKTAAILFCAAILLMPALSFASQSLLSNAYVVVSYLTSGTTQAVTGIYGTLLGAGGGIGSALGLLCGVQTAVLVGVGA